MRSKSTDQIGRMYMLVAQVSCIEMHMWMQMIICYSEYICAYAMLGQIKKISVFRVTGLKILDRVGTHFFCKTIIILCILKGILPIKMH